MAVFESAAGAVRYASIVMVSNADAVISIAQDQGMLKALAPGAIWAQMSMIGVPEFEHLVTLVDTLRPT